MMAANGAEYATPAPYAYEASDELRDRDIRLAWARGGRLVYSVPQYTSHL